MNKFELDKTMECFGLDKKDCYEINGCKYYNDGRYFTIVNGKIPYELAMLISNKYDNDMYKIRVNGYGESEVPQYDVYTYHIDTIEGLAAVLLETEAYYSKGEVTVKDFEKFLQLVYLKILQGANPNISVCDWMLNNENSKAYFKTILNAKTYLDFRLRRKMETFDNLVSPFCNDELDLNNSKFIVRGDGNQENNWFSLVDKDSGITMITIREKTGFVIKLCVPADEPYETTVYHYFDKDGEEIAFEKYDESGLSRIEYNLTTSTFGEHYGEKHLATVEDKKFVIQNLDKYILLANDMVKKNVETSFTKQKKTKLF